MLRTWFSTVRSESTSSFAIRRLVRLRATSLATSRSRRVRAIDGSSADGRLGVGDMEAVDFSSERAYSIACSIDIAQTFQVRVDVKNTGWAKLHKPRQAKLVLRNGSTTHVYNASSGAVASWAPGQTTTISVNAPAPSAGTYSVRLWIPDPDAQSRIPYAVKLATLRNSANVFDPNTGENNLGVSITVQ
jgi:Ni,Fe-hydrogenase III small subunit